MTKNQIYHKILKEKFIKYQIGRFSCKYFMIGDPNFKITICNGDSRIWIDNDKDGGQLQKWEYTLTQDEFINKFKD